MWKNTKERKGWKQKKEDEFSKLDAIETDSVGLNFISENMSD